MARPFRQPGPVTTDFRHEFERDSLLHLRRRFLWFAGVVIALNVLTGIVPWFLSAAIWLYQAAKGAPLPAFRPTFYADIIVIVAYWVAFMYVVRRLLGRQRLIDLTTWLMVGAGVLRMVMNFVRYGGQGELAQGAGSTGSLVLVLFASATFTHLLACMFIPWSPRDAMRPVVYLSVVFAIVSLVRLIQTEAADFLFTVAAMAAFPLTGLPGAALTIGTNVRFRETFMMRAIRGRYTEMKRELTDARRIHESLLPKPQQKGAIRFDYRYEPMRQIGGDYLYARFVTLDDRCPPVLNLMLLDVTGHGIPAALTVNRLYGEVERLFAEHPRIEPGEVLRALNRYVYLTLSDHSLFVTGLVVKVSPAAPPASPDSSQAQPAPANAPCSAAPGTIAYASAGHPPAFLRSVDGTIEQLDSTAPVLGAFVDADYEVESITRPFGPGDVFLGYTDGAMETRDGHGRMLGVNGLLRALAGTSRSALLRPGQWTQAIIEAVDNHRSGPPTDDTLVVEVACALDAAALGEFIPNGLSARGRVPGGTGPATGRATTGA